MMKKIIIFLYITAIGWTLNLMNTNIEIINIKPSRIHLNRIFQWYLNKPMILLNNGLIQRLVENSNRFYKNISVEWLPHEKTINISYDYEKPSLIYKDYVVTSWGNFFHYDSSLLLPIVNENISKKDILMLSKNLYKYFSIKLIKEINYENYNWIIIFRNNQKWYLGWDLNKFFNKNNQLNKKITKKIIENSQYEKIFFIKGCGISKSWIKNNLLIKISSNTGQQNNNIN